MIKQEDPETTLRTQPDSALDLHYKTEYRIAKEGKEKRGGKPT
jgi:hypothetical protein